ncbi:alpha/beta hydrolase family esterase [bacterium]
MNFVQRKFARLLCVLICYGSLISSEYSSKNNQRITFEHNGYVRSLLLHEPENHANRPGLPLLMVLHGGGGTSRGMIRLTKGRFNEIADEEGIWVVYPQGFRKHWNDQRTDPISFAHEENVDDVGFISEIIRRMIEKYTIDPNRVFVTGISNGGFMSFRLGMELSHKIKAIAPVTATIPVEGVSAVESMKGVNLMLMNGTEDPLVLYEGGFIKIFRRKRGEIVSTNETIRLWKEQLNCTGDPVETLLPDDDPADDTRVRKIVYASCEEGTNVVLYRVEGGGHTWPGGRQYLGKWLIGKTSRDINACDEIWEFLKGLN